MERLKDDIVAALNRDLAEQEAATDLAAIVAALDAYSTPDLPPGSTAVLVERLRPYMPLAAPARVSRRFRADGLVASPLPLLVGVFVAQVRLFRPVWWIITTLAALLCPAVVSITGLAAGLLAPPVVAAAVAYAFREAGSPAMEIEFSCPVGPGQVLATRMMFVQAWVAVLGTVPAAVLQLAGHPVALWPALTTWTAGMLLFGGVALLLTFWLGPMPGMGLSLVLWAAVLFYTELSHPVLPPWIIGNGLAAGAGLLLTAAALFSAGRFGAKAGKEA